MKRKLLCLLLCISMILPNVPIAVHADGAATCEHMEVSEDGTVSGNGVCEICSANEKVDTEEKEETDQKEDGNVQSEEKKDSEQLENEKIVSIENEDAGKSDTQETKKQQDSENGQTSQENTKQVSGNAVEEEKDSTISSNNKLLSTKADGIVDGDKIEHITYIPELDLPSNEELFAGYAEKILYGYSISAFRSSAGNRLSESEKALYDYLKEQIEKVAAGTTTSTQFTMQDTDKLSTWLEGNSFATEDELKQKLDSLSKSVTNALLSDCVYELYWFDKTEGTDVSLLISSNDGTKLTVTSLTISFSVAKEYQGSGYNKDTPTVDTNKTGGASAAKTNALKVVDDNSAKTDYEKLIAYRDYICTQVSYNNNAASNDYTGGYGDPWQLIYVFDGDQNTNVVCEGYAKAFMYLCDLTTWQDSSLSCYLATGVMAGGTGAGNHMWNIVTMGNQNYLVDVTNSDASSVGAAVLGAESPLFLVGNSAGSIASGYSFTIGNQAISYTYDQDTKDMWGEDDGSILKLATGNVGNNVQSEVDTWDEFIAALEDPSISKITLSGNIASPQEKTDDPFLITRDVTIYGTDNKHQITLNNGGIILGGNVKFEQITLNFINYVRNVIIANGYSLTMSGVSQNASNPIHIFCGTITGYSGNIPAVGNSGKIIFEGNNQLGNVYAGSFAEPNQIDQGNNTYISDPGTNNDWTKSSIITVSSGATYSGQIYGHGAWEKRDGSDPWGMVADSTKYKVSGNVTINLTNGSLVVDAATGGSNNATVNYVATKGDLALHTLKNVGKLALDGTDPKLQPAVGSTIDVTAGISLPENTELNIINLMNTTATNQFTIGKLNGGGKLVFGENQRVTITGEVTKTTKVEIEGAVSTDTPYITATSSQENSFTLEKEGYKFSKKDNGEWLALIDVKVIPDRYSIADTVHEISLDRFKAEGIEITVDCSIKEEEYLSDIPMNITVQKEGGGPVAAQVYYNLGYTYGIDDFGINIFHDESTKNLVIQEETTSNNLKAGVYTINLSVDTASGTQSFQIKLTVTDDAQTSVPDAIFNPLDTNDKGWYAGLTLHAPTEDYKISKTEHGTYGEEIEIEDGKYSTYEYWLKDTQGNPSKKTITELKVDGTSPDITKVEVSEVTTNTAKVIVEATDNLSGLNGQSYSLYLSNGSSDSGVTVGKFVGNASGGSFAISGMRADQTYTFELEVEDNAGSGAIKSNIEITPGKTNISTGQLKLNSGISYIYGENGNGGYGWEPKSGQLLLSLNGQTIPLDDTDFEYTYSNNINAGDSAQVTVTVKDSHGTYAGSVTGTFTIGKRPITITPKQQTIRNGNQIQTGIDQVQVTNLVSGHGIGSIILSQDNTNKVITASSAVVMDNNGGEVTKNYDITYKNGSLTILNPKITITPSSNIVYDGNAIIIGTSGTQNDVTYQLKECESPTVTWYNTTASGGKGEKLQEAPKDAGTYIVSVSAEVINQLGTISEEKQVTIKKAPLTATIGNQSIVYGGSFAVSSGKVTYTGFVNNESQLVVSGTPVYSSNYSTFGNVGTYSINANMNNVLAQNYEITVKSGILTVTPLPISVTWNNHTDRTYGDGKQVTATITNLVNNDQVGVTVSGGNATEVGTHTAKLTGLSGAKAGNYTISGVANIQSYSIEKAAALTNVVAERNVKWSQEGNQTFNLSDFTLPVNIKNPQITAVKKNNKTVDNEGIFSGNQTVANNEVTIPLTKSMSYQEGIKGVFDVTITSTTHEDITAEIIIFIVDRDVADQKITISISDVTYGQVPAPKGSFSGTKGNNPIEEYKYSKDGINFESLDSLKNASGFLPTGDYSVQYTYSDDGQIGIKTAAFRVEKKALQITFTVQGITKEYDGTTALPTGQFPTLIIREVVGNEQPKLVGTGIQFAYDNAQAGEGKTIQATGIALDTSEAINNNYTVENTVAVTGATITPKKVTVTPKTTYTKQYGTKDPVFEYQVTGMIGSDVLEGALEREAGEDANKEYPYIVSNLKNSNYLVELQQTASKFTITKAEANLTMDSDLIAQKAGSKVKLTVSAKHKRGLEAAAATQPKAVEVQGVTFVEKSTGVFEGEYTIPQGAKVNEFITVKASMKDPNYQDASTEVKIKVIEEEMVALPTPQQKPEAEGDKKPSYKLAMEKGISKIPEAFEKLGHLDTVEEIRDALKLEIKKLHSEITDATSAIYDVTLWYHPGDDDSVWVKAGKSHWPKSGKITVVLPYPEGTGKNTHNFNVTHMFTVEMNNNKPGTFEYPTVEKTDEGISFQVSGLSPITLGWTKIQEAPAPNPGSGNSTGGSSDSSEDSSSATTTTVIKRQDVKKEEAKATDTTAVAVAQEPAKQKNTKVTVKKEEKEVADNNVVSEKPEATQQTEDAVKEITEEVQEIEGIEEASKVPQDTTQKVQEETKSSSVLWIAAIVALAAAGVVFFILWKNKKNEEA